MVKHCLVGFLVLVPVAVNHAQSPTVDEELKQVQDRHAKSLEALQKQQDEEWRDLLPMVIEGLTAARKQALEIDDLDEAQRIIQTIKRVKALEGRTGFAVESAEWVTAGQKVDVTERLRSLLAVGEEPTINRTELGVDLPRGVTTKDLVIKVHPNPGGLPLPGNEPNSTADKSPTFSTAAAKDAVAKYKSAADELAKKHAKQWRELSETMIEDLNVLRKQAVASEDLAEAQRIATHLAQVLTQPPGQSSRIQVISAEWGAGLRKVDVTERVAELIQSGETVRVDSATLMVNDPAFGAMKWLTLRLNVDGGKVTFTLEDFVGIRFEQSH